MERLGTVDQSPLVVLSTVDEIGIVEGEFSGAVDDVIDSLDTKHERVVLVTDLVAPAAESATGVDAHLLQLGEELGKGALALEAWGWVAVVEAAVVGGDDFVLGLDHFGVDEALDGILEEFLLVDRFHGGFGDFQHDGPVRAWLGGGGVSLGAVGELLGGELLGGLWLVVWGVVGEDGGAVEGAVVFWEVELLN